MFAIIGGLALGSVSGWKRGGTVDRLGNGASLVLYSMPYFVIGMPLIIIFAAGLGWFPTSGMSTPGGPTDPIGQALDVAWHLVLPLTAVTLGLLGPVLDPDALGHHRDPGRGLHHHRPRQGPVRRPDPAPRTPSPTRCCRW